ncbi:hypothetical protein [Halorientalis pallida]|uniref:Envelope protein N-terminal domain-containing protein n=1 Tax=Halorientalis pallida TaxID=2479928 RepID=A0A498KX52_9EURY|nr:hypothetical protein [Halorientalis pallida]RXK46601.1 hypothetical protein EAF64_18140 [Halorientalis pallida]
MRESIRRALSVVMVFAVVGAGTVALINLDQGPEPVQQYGAVQDGEAIPPIVAYGAGAATVAVAGCLASECWVQEADLPEQKIDSTETQGEIYKSAQTTSAQIDVLADSTNNWQTQTANSYRRAGKSEFVRAINNGSSQSAAVTEAKQAAQDEYARSQIQLLKSYEAQVGAVVTMWQTAAQEQNLSAGSVFEFRKNPTVGWAKDLENLKEVNHTTTLVNGSSYTYSSLGGQEGGSNLLIHADGEYGGQARLAVLPPDTLESSDREIVLEQDSPDGYTTMWNKYESQSANVTQNLEKFAQSAYDSWSAGNISSADLVDPYMGARDFEPDGSQGSTWTQQQLLSLGITPPKNFSSIERMTVRDETSGMIYDGTLMSGGTPQGGGFEVGQTYNATEVPGIQYVVSRTAKTQLNGNFTLVNATGMDGGPIQSVDYTQPNLNTTNLQEFKEGMDDYRKFREEIEAREEKMRNESGSGGLLDGAGDWIPGLNGIQSVVALFVALFAVMFGARVVAGN